MKLNRARILIASVASLALFCTAAQGQTETLLESFEEGIDVVAVVGGGTRGQEDIALSQHTKAGADDLSVTHGEKALKINITNNLGWEADADLTLSQEASNLVKQAWASREEARYLIRYDVTFPNEGIDWGNFVVQVNGWDYAQLEYGGQENRSMSIPLDLVTSDLAAQDVVTLRIIDQYGAAGGTDSLEVIVDNIRLVDTYAPGAVPEVTLLNGFETQEDVDKLVTVSDRFAASLHTKEGPADVAVTEGEASLEIAIDSRGDWVRDFAIPFKGTIMEAIARVPQEDRLRYTLRMDVIFEERGENWEGDWQNFVVMQSGGGAQQFAMHRAGSEQHVRTYSATLDQLVIEPGDPNNPDDVNPGISITNQGAWTDAGMTMHIDNIRLIDTGKAPLEVRGLAVNAEGAVEVEWASSSSQAYGVQTSSDLQAWAELVSGVLGEPGAAETRYVDTTATLEGQLFYRVFVSGPAPPLNETFENGFNGWTNLVKATNSGSTEWEVGAPANGPGTAHGGTAVAGTDLDANYTDGTHVSLLSPETNLSMFLENPTLSFAYYLDLDADAAARINILDTDGIILHEGSEDNGLFFLGPQKTDAWTELSVELPVRGQKVILEFEIVDAGGDASNGAGFYIDDVFIAAPEE